jgi:hypothetical protein
MGHPGSVSRMISAGRTDRNMAKKCNELMKVIFGDQESAP